MLKSSPRLYLMHKPLAYVNAGVQSESCMTNGSTTCTLHPYILRVRIYDGEIFCNTTDHIAPCNAPTYHPASDCTSCRTQTSLRCDNRMRSCQKIKPKFASCPRIRAAPIRSCSSDARITCPKVSARRPLTTRRMLISSFGVQHSAPLSALQLSLQQSGCPTNCSL